MSIIRFLLVSGIWSFLLIAEEQAFGDPADIYIVFRYIAYGLLAVVIFDYILTPTLSKYFGLKKRWVPDIKRVSMESPFDESVGVQPRTTHEIKLPVMIPYSDRLTEVVSTPRPDRSETLIFNLPYFNVPAKSPSAYLEAMDILHTWCRLNQVSYSLHFCDSSDLWYFKITSAVRAEKYIGKDHSLSIGFECVFEHLSKFPIPETIKPRISKWARPNGATQTAMPE
jgi:hypothetical protein